MYQIAVFFVLIVPYIGLILITAFPNEYQWLTNGTSASLPVLYYSIFLIGAFAAALQVKKRRYDISNDASGTTKSEYPSLILLFIILLVTLVGYGGLDVFVGTLTKEDVRQSGFLHAILTKYLAPSIFAYLSILRRKMRLPKSEWWLALLMTFILGLSSGGKAFALIAILPGLAIIFAGRLSLSRISLIFVGTFFSLMLTASLFDSFLDRDLLKIAEYIVHRIFALTAEAPFHTSVAYSNSQPTIEYLYTLFEVFGKSAILFFDPSVEIHKYIFSHSFTAWLYPEYIDDITSGRWNITPNVFVEALIVGGFYLLPVIGWAVVYVAHTIWARVVRQINHGKYVSAAITSVYAVTVYLSWINSAGIMQLVHPLAIGSLSISWLCLRALSRTSLRSIRPTISRELHLVHK